MSRIKGETVMLWEKTQTGEDPFGAPEYEETGTEIDNVLVTPGASEDLVDSTDLTGKHIEYTLSIPKGDTHDWTGKKVTLRNKDYRTVGMAYYYTEENVPLDWNGRIMVERYE